jgi:sugar-specific transcriptional regulator TrmB
VFTRSYQKFIKNFVEYCLGLSLGTTEENQIQTLVCLGLTVNQAKLYLTSLKVGYATARELAQNSHIGREEVYRVLPSLQNLGLVKKYLNSPASYEPIDPNEAMSILISNKSSELSEVRRKAVEFVANTPRVKMKSEENDTFMMITNIDKALHMLIQAYRDSKHSCFFTSGYDRFILRMNMPEKQDQIKEMLRALNRGVTIRTVLDDPVDDKGIPLQRFNNSLAKKLVHHPNFQYKYINRKHDGLIASFDEKVMFIEVKQGHNVLLPQLWSNNRVLLGLGKTLFESAWASGISPIKKISN